MTCSSGKNVAEDVEHGKDESKAFFSSFLLPFRRKKNKIIILLVIPGGTFSLVASPCLKTDAAGPRCRFGHFSLPPNNAPQYLVALH